MRWLVDAIRFSVVLGLVGGVALGQGFHLEGPVSGFSFDAHSGGPRPIIGIPGAAYLAPALLSGYDFVSVAPDGGKAIGVREGRLFWIHDLKAEVPEASDLDCGLPSGWTVAWSADATAAVYYSGEEGSIMRVRWGPGAGKPPVCQLVALLPVSSGDVVFLEPDAHGTRILAGVRGHEEGCVYLLVPGSTPILVARVDRPAAAITAVDGVTVFVADEESGRVFELRNAFTSPWALPLHVADEPIQGVLSLALSPDGNLLYAFSREEAAVRVFNRRTQAGEPAIPLAFTPAEFERLPSGAVLLRTSDRDGYPQQFLLFDTRRGSAYFVPAGEQKQVIVGK